MDPPAHATPADPVGAIQLAWRIARSDYGLLLLLWLPALALQLAVGFAIVGYERAQGFAADPALMTTGEQMEWLGVVLPLSLLLLTTRVALWTFVGARVLDRVLGGKRLAGWQKLVGPAFAVGFVLVLTYLAGALLLLVGLFVFVHWFLYAPAFVAQGARGVGAALEASRRFARERRTQGFTALALLLGALVYGAWSLLGLLPGALGIVAPAIVAWLFGPVVPLLAASYVALALRSPKKPAQPDAVAAVERATTTCPKCARLIPYTPSAEGARIVCPNCGHEGRVF